MALVSIVVPVYHNASSLPDLLERFQRLADRNRGDRFEFVFVDDGSGDDSLAVLNSLRHAERRMRVVKLSRNFGATAAIAAGLSHAAGDAVAVISADLQDPPELIDEMLANWRQGHKVVLAARDTRDDPGLSSFLADRFYDLFRSFAIKTMPKRGFDFFLVDRTVCDLINGIEERNPYLMGLILWLGYQPVVLTYHRREREERFGPSMWTLARKLKYGIDSFVAFSYMPIRLASILGLGLTCLGILYVMIVVGTALFSHTDVAGWKWLTAIVLVVSGVQMTMTGVLGEYLWRNLEETRKRPRFIVDQIFDSPAVGEAGHAAAPRSHRSDAA